MGIMKIGIIGCGLNSDYHINFAKSYPGVEIVGIVDRDGKKAKDCAQKCDIQKVLATIQELVAFAKPECHHVLNVWANYREMLINEEILVSQLTRLRLVNSVEASKIYIRSIHDVDSASLDKQFIRILISYILPWVMLIITRMLPHKSN